jgi:hypothetical protein
MIPPFSRKPLQDEFTQLKVSRQRKWQLRKGAEGRCAVCGGVPVVSGDFCFVHRVAMAEAQRRYRGNRGKRLGGKWLPLLKGVAGERGEK